LEDVKDIDEKKLNMSSASYARLLLLLKLLGDPQKRLETVTVLGERGTEGALFMIHDLLSRQGYAVGLLVPSLCSSLRDCFKVNGEGVSTQEITLAAEAVIEAERKIKAVLKAAQSASPSAHQDPEIDEAVRIMAASGASPVLLREEIVIAMGIIIFRNKRCRLAVIPNIDSKMKSFSPPIATLVLTSAEKKDENGDHTSPIPLRGTDEVVLEPCSPTLFDAVSNACADIGARLSVAAKGSISVTRCSLRGCEFSYKKSTDIFVPSTSHRIINRCAAVVELSLALSRRGFPINDSSLRDGIASYIPRGRDDLFLVCAEPTVIMIDPSASKRMISDIFCHIIKIKDTKEGHLTLFISNDCSQYERNLCRLLCDHIEKEQIDELGGTAASLFCAITIADEAQAELSPKALAESAKGDDTVIYFCPASCVQVRKAEFLSDLERRRIIRRK
jgi:hypothetical protein